MKKFMLIALAAAVVLSGLSCASGGGSGGGSSEQINVEDQWWFVTREEGGLRARNNQVTLRKGDNYVYVYFRGGMPGADFEQVQLDFTVDREVEVFWQAIYDASVWGSDQRIGKMSGGTIATDCSGFPMKWYDAGNPEFIKSEMKGLVLKVNDPEGRAVFTMKNVTFIGLSE